MLLGRSAQNSACLLLLLLFLAPVPIAFLGFQLQKKACRKEVKSRLLQGFSEKELTMLAFSKQQASQQVHWEHQHEFEYQGKMYDVVKRSFTKDSVIFWCWEDHKETKLNQTLALAIEQAWAQNPQRKSSQQLMLRMMKCSYLLPSSWSGLNPLYTLYRQNYPLFESLQVGRQPAPLSPPPEQV